MTLATSWMSGLSRTLNRSSRRQITRHLSNSTVSTGTVATNSKPARLRFAPSPTGYLHLGGLRTALFNHLLARKWKGKWILRIEDTDRTRLVPGAVESLQRTLDWVGLDYDEGPGAGGSYGPYVQSDRLEIYHHYTKHLLERGLAYECFCSSDELKAMREASAKQGQRDTYNGKCRHLTEEERGRRRRARERHVVRFKTPTIPVTLPEDIIFGRMQFAQDYNDDFVLLKSDGFPTYHLANVVDDHEMEISHVLRGEEWLPSVPKHHQLYKAFGWEAPAFAHLPLLVNMDGTKLSKRTGDTRVEHYRDEGYEPEALLNFLALMGWDHHSAVLTSSGALNPTNASSPSLSNSQADTENLDPSIQARTDGNSLSEVFTIPELIQNFSLEHVNHRKAAVNLGKLEFINKMTLRRKAGRLGDDGNLKDVEDATPVVGEKEEMVRKVQEAMREVKVLQGNPLVEDREYVEKLLDAELARTVKLSDIATSSVFFFLEPEYDRLEAKELIANVLQVNYVKAVETVMEELEKESRAHNGEWTEKVIWKGINKAVGILSFRPKSKVLIPLRHAITGRKKGPSVPAIMAVLGKKRSMERLQAGAAHVKSLIRERERNKKQAS